MTDPTPGFNTTSGQQIARETLIAYLNTGTSQSPTWSAIGKYVTDSTMSYDWGDTAEKDILGNTNVTMKAPVITQTFDPLNLDSADSAIVKIWELAVRDQNPQALCAQDVLVAHFYDSPNTASPTTGWAERYSSSMVKPTGLGGEGGGSIEMPVEITYGGVRTIGSVTRTSAGVVTFTANSGS